MEGNRTKEPLSPVDEAPDEISVNMSDNCTEHRIEQEMEDVQLDGDEASGESTKIHALVSQTANIPSIHIDLEEEADNNEEMPTTLGEKGNQEETNPPEHPVKIVISKAGIANSSSTKTIINHKMFRRTLRY